MSEPIYGPQEQSYYQRRCLAIGLNEANNKLSIKEHKAMPDSKVIDFPLMAEDKKTGDILIPVYTIDGEPAFFEKENHNRGLKRTDKPFEIRRYAPGNERETKDGNKIKYDTPKGAKTLPWIAPNIIYDYAEKKEIDTIVITEGYIKGISGYLNGLHIFALSGIQNSKDKDTGTLHPDIIRVIKECKVKNVILLYDGDCTNISLVAMEKGKDLYQRPAGFFYSARNINELLKDHKKEQHFDIYFAHVNTNNLETEPKGLDDLYEAYPGKSEEIKAELLSYSKQKPHYFIRINITVGTTKVLNHLHISNAETFYTAHNQAIGDKPFVFHGTKYQFDAEKKELKVVIPGAARNYFRVGDNYYEKLHVPNKYGVLEYRYDRRMKSTIQEDHGKELVKHIHKYKAFCCKPDHANYQEVIDNCYNRYRPFEHTAGESPDCPEIMAFMQHIFGEQLELGLDYVQLLYQQPTQMLPILCLVSRENNTGKSTFGKLLKAIFTGNMAVIGNADLESDFNAGWADKLLICCEESFIDKKKTVEKIKSLSTGDKIQMNQKGIDQMEIDFFGKFIFMSNNEDNFVIANEYEERFWVRRINKAEQERTNLLDLMIDEIPNFLYFLNSRILSRAKKSRMWFDPKEIKTDALKVLIEGNQTGAVREFKAIMSDLFVATGFWELRFTLKYIAETILRNKYERNYVNKILQRNFNVKPANTAGRFNYPEITRQVDGSVLTDKISMNVGIGKPYTFKVDQFLTAEELETFELSDEAKFEGQQHVAPKEVVEKSNNKGDQLLF